MPKSKGFVYAYSVGQVDSLLQKIKSSGRPEKLTLDYVKNTWLLRNAQFSAVIDLLKEMKFLAPDGTPSELYAEYQNDSLSKQAITKGIHNAYPALLKAYPKADKLSKGELEGYIKQQTGAEISVVEKIYGTIKKLFSLGDLSSLAPGTETVPHDRNETFGDISQFRGMSNNFGKGVTVNINIQLTVPETSDEKIYESFFKAMKKHLLS